MLPASLREALEVEFGVVQGVVAVSGGDTSSAARVEAGGGVYFVKWGRGQAASSYAPEADGLRALAAAAPEGIFVPEVLATAPQRGEEPGYLVLPWLQPGRPGGGGWRRFGESLAMLHLHAAALDGYGWTRDNYLGLAPQRNGVCATWPEFYATQRLGAIREYVRGMGQWDARWDARLDRLLADLPARLPAEPRASLVHGDLWSGNAHALADGRFALIDPAVYVGHAEVDLAATTLFGGYAPGFYEGYRSILPEEAGHRERERIYQLYHWMMHLVVSTGYGMQVGASLRALT